MVRVRVQSVKSCKGHGAQNVGDWCLWAEFFTAHISVMQSANPKKFHHIAGKTFSFLFIPILIQHSVHRAANPFTRLKCSKIRCKWSNLILNAMYMVLLRFPRNICQNRCLTWSAETQRAMCTTKKCVKSISAWITSKCCEDSISQPTKWEIFSVLPIAFPLLMWHFQLTCCSTSYILPWATEKSQEAGTALHILGALHLLYNAQKLFCKYTVPRKFGVHFSDKIYLPGTHFQLLLRHDNLKWLKMEVISPGKSPWYNRTGWPVSYTHLTLPTMAVV